jgi:hypothetical protein
VEAYQRQQFDFLLVTAAERFVERIVQRNEGAANALERLRANPQGEGIWLDAFVQAIFQDFLLDNLAGACFILQALARKSTPAPPVGTIEAMLISMARRAFADLLARKTEELLEQQIGYGEG